MLSGFWTKNSGRNSLELKNLCRKAENLGNLKELVIKNTELKKAGWEACQRKARREGWLKKVPLSSVWVALAKKYEQICRDANPKTHANLRRVVLADGELSKIGWSACYRKAERSGWLEGYTPGPRRAPNSAGRSIEDDLENETQTENKLPSHVEISLREESIAAIRFKQLFGDLKKVPRICIPKTSGDTPYEIEVKDVSSIGLINSPLVGTLPPKDDGSDIFKNSIRLAQSKKNEALLITGNLIYCLVEKYGKQRPYRTQVIGVVPDPKLVEASYPPAVLKEIGPLVKRIDEKKAVFVTIKVYLDHVFQEVRRKFLDANDKPIFTGKVYVVLGEIEEAVAMYYANEALRAEVFQEKALAHKKTRELRAELRKIPSKEDREIVLQEITDWEVYDRILALMGNFSPDAINDRSRQMINYLAYMIETNIPNAKVIGVGDTYLRTKGGECLSCVADKVSNSADGGLAGRLRKKVYNYVKAHSGDQVPEFTLGGGLNPWGTCLYASFRVKTATKKRQLDDVRMSEIIQLLPCVDADLYRQTVRVMVKSKDRIAKLASTTNFESGMAMIWLFGPGPLSRFEWYNSDFLTNKDIFGSKESFSKFLTGEDPRSKRIYAYKEGCTHFGASHVARYDSPKDPTGRYLKYHSQVLFETFLRDGAPIHLYQNDGDIQHWMNYQTFKEGNPQWRDPEQMYKILTDIENDSGLSDQEKLKQMKIVSLKNMIVAGVMQPEDQIELYARSLAPYAKFFQQVIERSLKAGLVFNGLLSAVSIGQGNHNEHTFKGNTDVRFSEAKLTRKEIISMLRHIGFNDERLEQMVVACQIGGEGMANGTFKVGILGDKAYEYCLFMKHRQGSSKVGDNMKDMIRNFSNRGSADDYEEGKFTINLAGDDHMGGHAVTRNAFHVKTGGQMFSAPFGLKHDFPKQNLFSSVWSVPAGGPYWGPLSVVRFDFRVVRKLADYRLTLPKKLFENPI